MNLSFWCLGWFILHHLRSFPINVVINYPIFFASNQSFKKRIANTNALRQMNIPELMRYVNACMWYNELFYNFTSCAMTTMVLTLVSSTSTGQPDKLPIFQWKDTHHKEIWQTNFDTAYLSRLHFHIRHKSSCMLVMRSWIFLFTYPLRK